MKKTKLWLSTLLAVVFATGFVSCGDDDDKDEPTVPVVENELKVSASSLLFSAEAGEKQVLTITCTGEWTAMTNETWIDLSPKNGDGNGNLTITINSANSTSQERVATVIVTSEDLSREIIVTQKASLVANCTATPIDIAVLSDEFAFGIDWGKNVAYFQYIVIAEKDSKRMTDSELIEKLKDRERLVEKDDYFFAILGDNNGNLLTPETEYVIVTLAHDDKGEMGDLLKTVIKTKNSSNQPEATVSDLTYYNGRWYWTNTMNAFVSQYYTFEITSTSLSALPVLNDAAAAYMLAKELKENPNSNVPCIQNGSWSLVPKQTPYFYTCSWAQNKSGEWSGVISYDWASSDWYTADRPYDINAAKKVVSFDKKLNRVFNSNDFTVRRVSKVKVK